VSVELAYAIGVAEPVEVSVSSVDYNGDKGYIAVPKHNLTPKGIIDFLDLKKPIYRRTAKWGHFGNNLPWDE